MRSAASLLPIARRSGFSKLFQGQPHLHVDTLRRHGIRALNTTPPTRSSSSNAVKVFRFHPSSKPQSDANANAKPTMGKRKSKNQEYNTFLDDEKPAPQQPPQPQQQPPHQQRVEREKLTHFLCLPLTLPSAHILPQLHTSLSTLTSDTDASNPAARFPALFPPDAVRPAGTLHLTLGVMALTSPADLTSLETFVKELDVRGLLPAPAPGLPDSTAEGKEGVELDLRGLHAMRDPGATSVLYATPVATNVLGEVFEAFATGLRDAFTEAGFVRDEGRGLKLHGTVVNTIYCRSKAAPGGGGRGGRGRRGGAVKFDARGIVEAYSDGEGFVWAKGVRVDRVQVCEMGARTLPDGSQGYAVVFEKTFR